MTNIGALLSNPMAFCVALLAMIWVWLSIKNYISTKKIEKSEGIVASLKTEEVSLKVKLVASLKDMEDVTKIENAKSDAEIFDELKKNVENK